MNTLPLSPQLLPVRCLVKAMKIIDTQLTHHHKLEEKLECLVT